MRIVQKRTVYKMYRPSASADFGQRSFVDRKLWALESNHHRPPITQHISPCCSFYVQLTITLVAHRNGTVPLIKRVAIIYCCRARKSREDYTCFPNKTSSISNNRGLAMIPPPLRPPPPPPPPFALSPPHPPVQNSRPDPPYPPRNQKRAADYVFGGWVNLLFQQPWI